MEVCFRVNRPNVICETFDDEVVAVNFETGSYYGMRGSALETWSSLDAGESEESIVAKLASRENADLEQVRADVRQFLARLEAENLVVPCEAPPGVQAAPTGGGREAGLYEPPQYPHAEQIVDVMETGPEGRPNGTVSGGAYKDWRDHGSKFAQLAVYEDMQDLLLLDPIHDVDETGWPARKSQEPNAE